MKIIDSLWFTSLGILGGCIGIVLGEDEVTGEKKAYIGTAVGDNQERDERHIAMNGAKFTPEIAEVRGLTGARTLTRWASVCSASEKVGLLTVNEDGKYMVNHKEIERLKALSNLRR